MSSFLLLVNLLLYWHCEREKKRSCTILRDKIGSALPIMCHFQPQLSVKLCDLGFNFRAVLKS